jgi:hypothetical protein
MADRLSRSWLLLPAAIAVVAAGYAWGRSSAVKPSQYDESAAPYVPPSVPRTLVPLDAKAEQAARLAFWDTLRSRVDTEAPDPAWRSETEAAIRRVLPARFAPPMTVTDAKCAATICRVTLAHPGSPRIPEATFMDFTLDRESLGTMEIQLDTRNDGSTTLYFLRPGPAPATPAR